MLRLKLRKKAFTLAETMIVCTIFAMIVVGIILGINRAFVFMNNTKLDVIATNLAREGVEMMYNIRDTNWRKHSGEKEQHWLDMNGSPGAYCLFGAYNTGFFYLNNRDGKYEAVGPSCPVTPLSDADLYSYYNDVDVFFSRFDHSVGYGGLSFLDEQYTYYSGDQMMTAKVQDLLGNDVKFFRVMRVYGVYKKNVNGSSEICNNDTCLKDGSPKELRFCVKVFYRNSWGKHAKELCSVMTNFME